MRIAEMNWMQVEEYLTRDDRAVMPLGSVEQHAYLSLATDAMLAERVAVEAAEPLGVPVFPAQPYGVTPYFKAFPGTVTLKVQTYLRLMRDLLDGIADSGFRRILVVNGHGGNSPAQTLCAEWTTEHPDCRVKFHNWWNAAGTLEKAKSIDPVASHASWMEGFPWTRVTGATPPTEAKPMLDWGRISLLGPAEIRRALGDGNFGGLYQRPDADMQALWEVAVAETRALLEGPWG